MPSYSQAGRALSIDTPLGKDAVLLQGYSGIEGISRLFRYDLDLAAEETIDLSKLIGQRVTITVFQQQDTTKPARYINGFINRASFVGKGQRLRFYRAELVPWFWFLTCTTNCRIFQEKKVPDIIKGVFTALGFSGDKDARLIQRGTYNPRDYCVQYRETDFNFVSRLMEEEGLYYYFEHSASAHTMVMSDSPADFKNLPYDGSPAYHPVSSGLVPPSSVISWTSEHEFRPGKFAYTDYNFETPSTSLLAKTTTLLKEGGNDKFEIYDYPGEYAKTDEGERLVKVRMQEIEAGQISSSGSSNCRGFTAGFKFKLSGLDIATDPYLLTEVQSGARVSSYASTERSEEDHFSNSFTGILASRPYRPRRVTPRPVMNGPQPAIVVGTSGEEIYTDKYGRVKVQFYWDREGKKDDKSSCWIRVSQPWAGKQWGAIAIPRIGQEVIVDFYEGDPDQPIITGRVYNAEQMPPYAIPANQTQSGMKSRSSKQGGSDNFNELRYEDKKGSEEIYFHAEKDFNRVVENNDTLKVGSAQADDGSQTIEIWKDRTETVKTGNEKVTIEQGNRDVIVKVGNDSHKIETGNRSIEVSMGNDSKQIKMGNESIKIDLGKSEKEALQSIELKVGQSSVKLDQMGVTIKGMMISIEAQIMSKEKAPIVQVNGDGMVMIKGGITMIN